MDSADAPSTGGGADVRAASGPSRVLLHVQVIHAGSTIVDQIRLDGFIFLIYWRNSCLQQHEILLDSLEANAAK